MTSDGIPPTVPLPEPLVEQFARVRGDYESYGSRLVELIQTLLHHRSVSTQPVEYRVKDLNSFAEKVVRKSYVSLDQNDDLLGVRVIAYLVYDVNGIIEMLRSEFEIIELVTSADRVRSDQFSYGSTHAIIRLKEPRSHQVEWSRFVNLKAEIQVRTVAQHAWAVISHKISYKVPVAIPRDLKRRMARISALFEVVDHEFEALNHAWEFHKHKVLDHPPIADDVILNIEGFAYHLEREQTDIYEIVRKKLEADGFEWWTGNISSNAEQLLLDNATTASILAEFGVNTAGLIRAWFNEHRDKFLEAISLFEFRPKSHNFISVAHAFSIGFLAVIGTSQAIVAMERFLPRDRWSEFRLLSQVVRLSSR